MKQSARLRKKLSPLQRPPQSRTLEEELRACDDGPGRVRIERNGVIRGDAADRWLREHGVGWRRQQQPPETER